MARPEKPAAARRERWVGIRLTADEHAAVSARAAAAGMSVSELVRLAALRRSSSVAVRSAASEPDPVSFALADQLRRIGVNLNQLTRITYLGHDRHDELVEVIARISEILDRVHARVEARRRARG